MSKAIDSIYRMFDYFTGRFEPEDREEYLDALSCCFNLQLPWRIDEDFKKNKDLDQDGWNDLADLQKLLHDIRKLPQYETLGDVLKEHDAYRKALWQQRDYS